MAFAENREAIGMRRIINKETFRETVVAYMMVLPAVLIIFSVALWPVMRSFWYSMFDIRLNHPTMNSTSLQHVFDLERFFGSQFYVNKAIKNLERSDIGEKSPDKVASIKHELAALKEDMLKIKSVSSCYPTVQKLIDSMKPVADPKLRFARISKNQANSYLDKVEKIKQDLQSLIEKKNDAADEAFSIMEDLRTSIVKPNFVGFGNYAYFLKELTVKEGELGRLGKSLLNTLNITIVSVFLELVFGIGIALLINRSFKGRGLTRAAILVPWAIPTVVSARMWAFLYDGQTGIIAHWLASSGLIKNSGVLMTTKFGAFCSVVFADVWKTTPYMALLLLAGLQTISDDLYEAANIDGASRTQQFLRITLPLLKSTILVALLFRTLDAFRIFDLIYVLTGGGPGNSTETISIYAYVTMFSQMDFGKGSTLSIVVFICISLISIAYIKLLGADVMQSHGK